MKASLAILTAVAGVAMATSAQAQFTAYNDCQFSTTAGNAANTTLYGTNSALVAGGPLKDFVTGVAQAATVTFVNTNGAINGGGPAVEFTTGTPAATMFGGKVANKGSVNYYGSSAWSYDLVFNNLTPGAKYTLATTIDRGTGTGTGPGGSYVDRWSVISLVGSSSSIYASSAGAVQVSATATGIQSYNTPVGYLAQWTDIDAGPDNSFSVHFTNAVGTNPTGVGDLSSPFPAGAKQDGLKAYGPAMFMLQETVPEPTSLSLLSLAVLPLLRRRRD